MDPHDRIDMTGPWAGFGFQGGHMFTPEGHSLQPCDMTWWSLTCNIAREWRLMMEEARPRPLQSERTEKPSRRKDSTVIYLRDALRARRERHIGVNHRGTLDQSSNVIRVSHWQRSPSRR